MSEAITKGVLNARRGTAPFATNDSAYGAAPGGRSTVGKVINSQGQGPRGRGEAKVPLNPDKVRKMTYDRTKLEIKQSVQENSRKQKEKDGFFGWSDNDRDADRAVNLAKNRVSNINNLPGASSNEMKRQAGPYGEVSGMSSPRKGGADTSYKLRNSSSI